MHYASGESWAITLAMGTRLEALFGLLALAWARAGDPALLNGLFLEQRQCRSMAQLRPSTIQRPALA